jgi:hypothetical protein
MDPVLLDDWDSGFRTLIEHSTAVADFYGVELRYVRSTSADLEILAVLHGMIGGLSLPANELTLQMVKMQDTSEDVWRSLNDTAAYRLVAPRIDPPPRLFNVPVPTGPVVWHINGACVEHADQISRQIGGLPVGSRFELKLTLLSAVEGACRRAGCGTQPKYLTGSSL